MLSRVASLRLGRAQWVPGEMRASEIDLVFPAVEAARLRSIATLRLGEVSKSLNCSERPTMPGNRGNFSGTGWCANEEDFSSRLVALHCDLDKRNIAFAISPFVCLVVFSFSTVWAQTSVVTFTDRGWYDAAGNGGRHGPIYSSYPVGDNFFPYRNFFVFDLSGVSQQIASAKLALSVPSAAENGFVSADPSENYELAMSSRRFRHCGQMEGNPHTLIWVTALSTVIAQ